MTVLDLMPQRKPPPTEAETGHVPVAALDQRPTRLAERDAIEIWHARWFKIPHAKICRRYNMDSRRIYEVWEEKTFIGSRQKAWALLVEKHPEHSDRIDNGRHRSVSRRGVEIDQHPRLFDELPEQRAIKSPQRRRG